MLFLPAAGCWLLASGLSKSLMEPDLETEIVIARREPADGALLILRDEGQAIRDAIFQRQDLILVRSQIRRIGD